MNEPHAVSAGRRPRTSPRDRFQLLVTLRASSPLIWRRVMVPEDITLAKLDRVLQAAMGWTNSHLHLFHAAGLQFSEPDTDWDPPVEDERKAKLNAIAPHAGSTFVYEYDMGDSWEHDIVVERILPGEHGDKGSRLLDGRGACPPEDAGGIDGYHEKVQILGSPGHPEHEEIRIWIESMTGGRFDPDRFDAVSAQKAVAAVK